LNTLLIVDIQKSMGHWFPWSYLNKVDKFLRANRDKYDYIIMTMEPKFATNERGYMTMPYSFGADAVPFFILNSLTHEPLYKAYNGDFWGQTANTEEGYEVSLPSGRDSVTPYKMYLNEGLRTLISHLSGVSNVDIIGGGRTKCVDLTAKLLSFYNIPHHVLDEICYDIRIVNTNRRDENTFETEPISSIRKGLLGRDGKFPMVEVPLTLNP
jgi:hypothetical protein